MAELFSTYYAHGSVVPRDASRGSVWLSWQTP